MKKQQFLANALMLLGATIWGAAFVAQSIGADRIGPFAFGGIRFFLGALVIMPLMFSRDKKRTEPDAPAKEYLKAGVICGIALFLGATFQQVGLSYTTAGKAGFVSALYMILVPFFAFVVFRRKVIGRVWAAAFIALFGTFLLCISDDFSVNKGDVITFVGAIFWAIQILLLERFSHHLDGVKFAVYEFLSCSAISLAASFIFEHPTWAQVSAAAIPLLYTGLLSVGVGFTAQIICLQYTEPTVASLIMSTESVFSVIFGFLLLDERLVPRQLLGCALVFAAVILTQIEPKKKDAPSSAQ